jgi:DNA helicase-2/ATP-dependent DNA helicase PcrA
MTPTTDKKPRFNAQKILTEGIKWSTEQLDIFEAIVNSDRHIMIGAVAGSGKTTSIIGVVARINLWEKELRTELKVSVRTFNAHIADELNTKLPSKVKATTAHALGLSVMIGYYTTPFKINEHKYKAIAKSIISTATDAITAYVLSVVNMMQSTLTERNQNAMDAMIEHFDLKCDEDVSQLPIFDWVEAILQRGIEEAENLNLDFADCLWLPNIFNVKVPQKHILIIDEFQDTNAAMLGLYVKSVADGGRLIVFGDERQAIMGFGGSDTEAWGRFKARFDPLELPLTTCYRCPTSHLDLARAIVPSIQPRTNAPEGVYEIVSPDDLVAKLRPRDLVISRYTAPLVKLGMELVQANKQVKIRGQEIGENLSGIVKGAKPDFNKFVVDLEVYKARRLTKLSGDNAEVFNDKISAVLHFWQTYKDDVADIQSFIDRLNATFANTFDTDSIILSTVHKAKGSEAKNVYILECNKLPCLGAKGWQNEQEINLQYVALTRAKEGLYLVPESPELVSKVFGGMRLGTPVVVKAYYDEDYVAPEIIEETTLAIVNGVVGRLIKKDDSELWFYGELGKKVDRDRFEVEYLTETNSVPLLSDMVSAVFVESDKYNPMRKFVDKLEWKEYMSDIYEWDAIA